MVRWENWEFRIGFDQVEGLTLHQIGLRRDQGGGAPIVYRASVAEMVVPYGDPSPVRFWQNYFDTGEYSLGKDANSLELGCDCLGEIHYFDAVDRRRRRATRAASATRSACTRRTTACCGSTPTCLHRRQRRRAASAAW